MNKFLILSAAVYSLLMPACTTVVEAPVPAAPVTEVETLRETHSTTHGVYPPTTTTTETRTLRTE